MDPEDIARYVRLAKQAQLDVVRQARRLLDDVKADAALRTVQRTAQTVGPMLQAATKASAMFFEQFTAAMPPNWRPLTNPQIFDAVELMAGTGWSLVWTPPSETVVAILNAPDAEARRSILLSVEGKVLVDLEQLLDEIATEDLLRLRNAAEESRQAYLSGFFKASQALTATTLSTTLHEQLREKSHAKVAKMFRAAGETEARVRDFRWIAVQGAVAKALDDYHPVTGRPERSDFNRNASAHRVKEPQYRQVNALSGLMLLVSVLVELDQLAALTSQPAP
jgi:hypothetical protein